MFACAASAESELSSSDALDRRFVCDWAQCGKAFSHPDSLRVHYRRHTDEKPHHCHHCEAAYRQKSGLKYHLEKVHGEKTVGRCGRKRKLDAENSGILSSTGATVSSGGAFVSSRTAELCSKAKRNGGQTVPVADSVSVNVKNTELPKLREVGVSVSDLQAKQQSKLETESAADGRRWSLPESLSQDCDDDNLDNIDINDEWLLDENDGFISNHRKRPEARVNTADEGGERGPTGSTSDTEPLDEDLCEELRKLSDAINGEALSSRDPLDSMSPFDSPVGAAYGQSKSDRIGNIMPDLMPAPHSALYQNVGNHKEQTAVFDNLSSPSLPQNSDLTDDLYPRQPPDIVAARNTMLPQSDQTDMANGYLPDGYSCPDVHQVHFNRNISTSESSRLPVDSPKMVAPTPCHSSPFEDAINPWSVPVNSSRWSSHVNSNSSFMPARDRLSETGFDGGGICREDGTYSVPAWSLAENRQQWLGHDGIMPAWPQRRLSGPADLSRQQKWRNPESPLHNWHHPESPFSQSGTAFDRRVGFETSLKPFAPYRTDTKEVPSMSDHFINSLTAKHGAVYPPSAVSQTGAWSELYSRSSQMSGIGSYQYSLPGNVYRSPVQSEGFHLTSGYSGIHSQAGYERGIETEGSYGISNSGYRMPPVHASSWPGLSDTSESLRQMPDGQQSSMLYNVVPRYY